MRRAMTLYCFRYVVERSVEIIYIFIFPGAKDELVCEIFSQN